MLLRVDKTVGPMVFRLEGDNFPCSLVPAISPGEWWADAVCRAWRLGSPAAHLDIHVSLDSSLVTSRFCGSIV